MPIRYRRVEWAPGDLRTLWELLEARPPQAEALAGGTWIKVRILGDDARRGFHDAQAGLMGLDERLFRSWPSGGALASWVDRLASEAADGGPP